MNSPKEIQLNRTDFTSIHGVQKGWVQFKSNISKSNKSYAPGNKNIIQSTFLNLR